MSERRHYLIGEPQALLVVTIRYPESGASVIDCSHVRHLSRILLRAGIHVGGHWYGAMPLARSDPVISDKRGRVGDQGHELSGDVPTKMEGVL
jgi:hypothetical protein